MTSNLDNELSKKIELIDCLRIWTKFPMLVSKNLTGLDLSFPISTSKWGGGGVFRDVVIPQLHSNGIKVELDKSSSSTCTGTSVIAAVDVSRDMPVRIILGKDLSTPYDLGHDIVIMLQKHSRVNINRIDAVMQEYGGPCGLQAVEHIRQLANEMALSNLSTGFLSTNLNTLFLKLEQTVSGNYDLCISTPVKSRELGKCLAALTAELYFGDHNLQQNPVTFQLAPQLVRTPDVNPLSSYEEGSKGRLKWWIARKLYHKQILLNLDTNTARQNIIEGSLTIGTEHIPEVYSSLQYGHNAGSLANSASMLDFANSKEMKGVPSLLLYGKFMQLEVLVLQHLGHELTPFHMLNKTNIRSMHEILDSAHNMGIMVNSFGKSSFYLYYHKSAGPTIRFLGFANAKLYRHVPAIARDEEHRKLDLFIDTQIQSINY